MVLPISATNGHRKLRHRFLDLLSFGLYNRTSRVDKHRTGRSVVSTPLKRDGEINENRINVLMVEVFSAQRKLCNEHFKYTSPVIHMLISRH